MKSFQELAMMGQKTVRLYVDIDRGMYWPMVLDGKEEKIPLDPTWANTTVVDGELVEFVRDLRNQPGADIGVHASISVAQALLAAGVVDELRLVIAPTIAGSGRRLLDGLSAIRLESIRSTTSPTGSLLVDYRVVG